MNRYGRYIPRHLVNDYRSFLESGVDLREEIALIDMRIAMLLDKNTGISGGEWIELGELWVEFRDAVAGGNESVQARVFSKLDTLIGGVSAEEARWEEIYKLIDMRKNLVLAEAKRAERDREYVRVERVLALLSALVDSVIAATQKHVAPDIAREIVRDVASAYRRLTGANPVQLDGYSINQTTRASLGE